METIRNKVKESGLITLDLEKFKPNVALVEIDIADQLWQGFVLKEKDFRAWIKENDWTVYENKAVFIHCSADAIVPTWAFMLVSSQLTQMSVPHVLGSKTDLEKHLIATAIENIPLQDLEGGRIIVKGCADLADPAFAMCKLLEKIQPVSKSIMYGEPCSTVPVYKKKN